MTDNARPRRGPAPQFTIEEFEQFVVQALDDLPDFFKQKLQNVEVVVADWPSPAELRAVGLKPGQLLFGLYQGVPLTRRTSYYGLVLPDKITIYRLPIERVCRTRTQIINQVQRTVKHELAHHFGISDDRLRELGAY
jgi:predicted Zn-dependent protease with MMP-like domain